MLNCHMRVIIRQNGFSLLEILVAFAIMAVSLTILLQVFAGGMRGASITQQYQLAAVLAQTKLEAVGHTINLEAGEQSGSFAAYPDYAWTLSFEPYQGIEPWPLELKMPDVWKVRVEIHFGTLSTRTLTLTTLKTFALVDNR